MVKRTMIAASLLLPLATLIIGRDRSEFGFPVPFLIYKGGVNESLPWAYEVFKWGNLSQCSFNLLAYFANVLIVFLCLVLFRNVLFKR